MTDLESFLSTEEIEQFHRLPVHLRMGKISTNDIITLNPAEIAKKTHVSATAVLRLQKCVMRAMAVKEEEEFKDMDEKYQENERLYKDYMRSCPKEYMRDGEPCEEYLKLAPDENGKRKLDPFEEAALPEEYFTDLSDDDYTVSPSTKRRKLSITAEKMEAFEKSRAAYMEPVEFSRRFHVEDGRELLQKWSNISLLDGQLTEALAGGIAHGHITEVTGERYEHKTLTLFQHFANIA